MLLAETLALLFLTQKMPHLSKNNRFRSKTDPTGIWESPFMHDRYVWVRTSSACMYSQTNPLVFITWCLATCLPPVTFYCPIHTDLKWTGRSLEENRHRHWLLFLGPWTDLGNNRADLWNNRMDLILFIQTILTVQKQIRLDQLVKTTSTKVFELLVTISWSQF